MDDYFGRLTKLWDGIAECMKSKVCTCNKCECDLNSAHEKEREILRVHDILSGLDDSVHGVIRSQICAITPLPDLDSVYQTVSQNETLHSNTTADNPVMSFAAQTAFNRRPGTVYSRELSKPSTSDSSTNRGGQGSRDWSKQCSMCGKAGHETSACFKVIGFPEWWGERNKNQSDDRAPSSAGQGRGGSSRANAAQVNMATSGSTSEIMDRDHQGLIGISDDQWAAIQKLISAGQSATNLSGKSNDIFWILDTGATHHMTGRLDLLEDIRDITPVSVMLPAGADVMTLKQGTVRLTSQLSLQNVYYVDGFHTNLISLGQLVTDNYLVRQVTDKLMVLQDRAMRMLIGAGE